MIQGGKATSIRSLADKICAPKGRCQKNVHVAARFTIERQADGREEGQAGGREEGQVGEREEGQAGGREEGQVGEREEGQATRYPIPVLKKLQLHDHPVEWYHAFGFSDGT